MCVYLLLHQQHHSIGIIIIAIIISSNCIMLTLVTLHLTLTDKLLTRNFVSSGGDGGRCRRRCRGTHSQPAS